MGPVRDNVDAHRFELEQDGELATADYVIDGNVMTFTHVKVPPKLEGHGIGSALARAALQSARERNLKVIPACPFFATYMKRHPETASLLAEPSP